MVDDPSVHPADPVFRQIPLHMIAVSARTALADTLAHELGHYAGYLPPSLSNAWDRQNHNYEPGNLMHGQYRLPENVKDQRDPDECWCSRMRDLMDWQAMGQLMDS